MGTRDRRARIQRRVEEAGTVRVSELAEEFSVSEMTVRRDLDVLTRDGLVTRVRGGAMLARGGRRGAKSARTVGIVLPVEDYVYRTILRAVNTTLTAAGARSRMQVSNYTPELERELVEGLLDGSVDGLLFAPTLDEEKPDQDHLAWIAQLPVPVVLVERRLPDNWPGPSVCSVRASFTRGLTQAAAHLAGLGHTRIAFFGHVRRMSVTALEAQWEEIIDGLELDPSSCPFVVDKDYQHWTSAAEPERVLSRLRGVGVTALICRDDPVALTMAHHAQRIGLRIPEDLSLLAYDDEMATMCDPPLSAISPPKEALGQAAAELLLERMEQRRRGDEGPTVHLDLEPQLVVRSSTAPPGHQADR